MDFLFGYKSSVYTSLTFQYGTEQPLHRDTPAFRTEPEEFYFGVWFALEDASEENGALAVLEGAHREIWVDPFDFADSRPDLYERLQPHGSPMWAPYQSEVVKKAKEAGHKERIVCAQKGDVIIWHPQLPHGGSKILDPSRTRMSMVYHVVPEGVPVYQADVFFDRNASVERKSTFNYENFGDREFVKRGWNFGSN